jgi:hypothetical protein
MKRYLAFSGDTYYPGGGWNDFNGGADTVDEARKLIPNGFDWYQIVDTETQTVMED